jgi:hypothetical protein
MQYAGCSLAPPPKVSSPASCRNLVPHQTNHRPNSSSAPNHIPRWNFAICEETSLKRLEKYLLLLAVTLPVWVGSSAFASCSNSKNTIEAENCLPGVPQSQWDISGAGDSTIQGFATSISVNQGQTMSFKVNTNATSYKLDIYRLGYYGGNGARLVATVQPSATLPQNQPACLKDSSTNLVDCGNWGVSASWSVPSTLVDRQNDKASSHAFMSWVTIDDGVFAGHNVHHQ